MGSQKAGRGLEEARPPRGYLAFAFAASHSALVISRYPLPLQEFWPLQALLALLHAECPLQELTPSHFTFPSSARAVLTATAENITAAAAAPRIHYNYRSPRLPAAGALPSHTRP